MKCERMRGRVPYPGYPVGFGIGEVSERILSIGVVSERSKFECKFREAVITTGQDPSEILGLGTMANAYVICCYGSTDGGSMCPCRCTRGATSYGSFDRVRALVSSESSLLTLAFSTIALLVPECAMSQTSQDGAPRPTLRRCLAVVGA